MASMGEQQASVASLAGALKDLLTVEGKSAAQKESIEQIIEQLNESVPELTLAYDREKDALVGLTGEELDAALSRAKAQEEYQAQVARLTELYAERTEIETQLEAAEAALAKAQQDLNEAMDAGAQAMSASSELAGLRTIDLIESTIPYLLQLKQIQKQNGLVLDKVCVWPDGRTVRSDYITARTRRIMEKYGLEHIRVHDLSHTAATLLASQATLKQVQEFLGHENISTTGNIYAHLMDRDRKATSDIMDGVLRNSVFCSEKCSDLVGA